MEKMLAQQNRPYKDQLSLKTLQHLNLELKVAQERPSIMFWRLSTMVGSSKLKSSLKRAQELEVPAGEARLINWVAKSKIGETKIMTCSLSTKLTTILTQVLVIRALEVRIGEKWAVKKFKHLTYRIAIHRKIIWNRQFCPKIIILTE